MKRKLLILATIPLILFAGACSEIEDRLNELSQRVDDHESRITTLEEKVTNLNEQVTLLKTLLSGKYFVQDVSDLADGSGYKLTLVDDQGNTTEKTVFNGEDGDTPDIGLKLDQDGNYYWTINGQWMLVGGEKVRANGTDGKTAEFKIEDGKWYVKIGDGAWQLAGDAKESFFALISSIDADSSADNVVFKLTDGTTIEVPKGGSAVKLHLVIDESAFAEIAGGVPVSAHYDVVAPAGISFTLRSYEPDGWNVIISPTGEKSGTITVVAPQGAVSGKILLILVGSDGSNFVTSIEIGVREQISYSVDEAAHQITLTAAVSITVPEGITWITVDGNVLVLSENTSYDSRSAIVTYVDSDSVTHTVTVIQAQKDAIVLPASALEAGAEGGTLEFVIKANVTPSVSTQEGWLHPQPATKGLTDQPYVITVDANGGFESRTGTVSFTHEQISQNVTITQEGRTGVTAVVYELVDDASSLESGDEILIVNLDGTYAMGEQVNASSTYRGITKVTVENKVIEEISQSVAVITLEGTSGAWVLHASDGYLAATSADKNYLQTTQSFDSDYAKWTIAISSNGEATVKAKAGSRNQICYNSSATRFSCYASASSSQKAVSLYRKTAGGDPTAVLQYSTYGAYVQGGQRSYAIGIDQYLREYEGSALTYVLMNPAQKEQLVITGYSNTLKVGDSASISVNWKQGKSTTLKKTYKMTVVKDENSKVWLGDTKGNGIIIRK